MQICANEYNYTIQRLSRISQRHNGLSIKYLILNPKLAIFAIFAIFFSSLQFLMQTMVSPLDQTSNPFTLIGSHPGLIKIYGSKMSHTNPTLDSSLTFDVVFLLQLRRIKWDANNRYHIYHHNIAFQIASVHCKVSSNEVKTFKYSYDSLTLLKLNTL